MSDNELIWMSAHELAAGYRSRTISPVEVVNAVLDRLDAVDSKLNAFVTVTGDHAREQAQLAEQQLRRRDDLPPLFGVPIAIKDLVDTAGVRTTYGCVAFENHVPGEDALGWERLKRAGTILIGKTSTPEFGLLGTTESKLTGSTSTPWDTTRTSGGSSGGAAAAAAAGVGPLHWGSDGGGSIRVPASCCGTVGVKPTVGRIPHAGNIEPDTTEGPITRRVVDSAMILDATVGRHPRDRFTVPDTGERYADAVLEPGDLSGLRVAVSANLGGGSIDDDVEQVFLAALATLEALGATLDFVEMSLPDVETFGVAYWGPEYILLADSMTADGVDVWPEIREIADTARGLTPVEVSFAVREHKTKIYDVYEKVFRHHDLLVTLTTPLTAFPLEFAVRASGEDMRTTPTGRLHSLTASPSHAGVPAVSVPCGFTNAGLPVGMQIIGPLYDDLGVVVAAGRYEREAKWYERRPDI